MNILIIGATSAIARSVSRLYAVKNSKIFLVARDELLLQEAAIDLEVRGAKAVGAVLYDAENTSDHSSVINSAVEFLGSIDIALICHGNLPNQEECQANYEKAKAAITVNGLSVISLCTEIVNKLRKERKGTLAIITSVAGERGRQPNFVYGAAKSMVSTYLQCLRGSLLNENIHIIDIRQYLYVTYNQIITKKVYKRYEDKDKQEELRKKMNMKSFNSCAGRQSRHERP